MARRTLAGLLAGGVLVAWPYATLLAASATTLDPSVSKLLHVVWTLSSPHFGLASHGGRGSQAFSMRFRLRMAFQPPGGPLRVAVARSARAYSAGKECAITGIFNGIPAYSVTSNGRTLSVMLDPAKPRVVWLTSSAGIHLSFGQVRRKAAWTLRFRGGPTSCSFGPGGLLPPSRLGGPIVLEFHPSEPFFLGAVSPLHGGTLQTMTWFNPLPWGSSTFPVSAATVAFRPGSDAATHGEKSSGYRTTSFLVQFIDIRTGPRATEVPIHQGIAALRRDGFKVRKGLAIFARLFVPALTKPGRGKARVF